MGRDAIVAGTGYEGRAEIIRKSVRSGMGVTLRREPNNRHDPNAIAVWIEIASFWGIFGKRQVQIGYIKSGAAASVAKKMDGGVHVTAQITSFYAPGGREHPRVSLRLDWPDA